jgi:hypothetical protein
VVASSVSSVDQIRGTAAEEHPVSNDPEPPERIEFDLEESLDLLSALEHAQEALSGTDYLAVLAHVEQQIAILNRKLGYGDQYGGPSA